MNAIDNWCYARPEKVLLLCVCVCVCVCVCTHAHTPLTIYAPRLIIYPNCDHVVICTVIHLMSVAPVECKLHENRGHF